MLTASDDPLTLDMARDSAKDKSHHHLSRDAGDPDQYVVTRVFLLALLDGRIEMCFPPVFELFNQSPKLIKDYRECSYSDICQLPLAHFSLL